MRFRNVKTGAILEPKLDVAKLMMGSDVFQLITDDLDYADMTVAQLKSLLTERGISFSAKAKKDELIALL